MLLPRLRPSVHPSIHHPAWESMEHKAFSLHRGEGWGDQRGQHSTLAWTPSPFLRHSSGCFPQTQGRWLRVPAGIPCASMAGRGHAGLTRGLTGPRLRLPRGTLAGARWAGFSVGIGAALRPSPQLTASPSAPCDPAGCRTHSGCQQETVLASVSWLRAGIGTRGVDWE